MKTDDTNFTTTSALLDPDNVRNHLNAHSKSQKCSTLLDPDNVRTPNRQLTEEEKDEILYKILNEKQDYLKTGIRTRSKTLRLKDPENFKDKQPIYCKEVNFLKLNRYTYCNRCDRRYQDINQHYRKSHPDIPQQQPKKKRRSKREMLIDLCNLQFNEYQKDQSVIPFGNPRTSEELNREFETTSEGKHRFCV